MIVPNPDEEPTNVICLSEARKLYSSKACQHKRVEIDERLAEVECRDCGEKLNPIHVLVRMAREESMWKLRLESMQKLKADLDEKLRTKCRHCGQMTPVRVTR